MHAHMRAQGNAHGFRSVLFACRYPSDIPKQYNGCDCGVFALAFADYASRDAPLTFSQKHMELLRLKIASDIMDLIVS